LCAWYNVIWAESAHLFSRTSPLDAVKSPNRQGCAPLVDNTLVTSHTYLYSRRQTLKPALPIFHALLSSSPVPLQFLWRAHVAASLRARTRVYDQRRVAPLIPYRSAPRTRRSQAHRSDGCASDSSQISASYKAMLKRADLMVAPLIPHRSARKAMLKRTDLMWS